MIKLVNILFIFFIGCKLYSQSNFIQIEVTDTLVLAPNEIIYSIKVSDDKFINAFENNTNDIDEYFFDNKGYANKLEDKKQDLKNYLIEKGYNPQPIDFNPYEINPPLVLDNSSGFKLSFENVREIEQLKKDIQPLDYVEGEILSVDYETDSISEKRLIKKLFYTAKRKAQYIAEFENKKIGDLISFKEIGEKENLDLAMHDLYFTVLKANNYSFFGKSIYTSISKTGVFKFELE